VHDILGRLQLCSELFLWAERIMVACVREVHIYADIQQFKVYAKTCK